ncbi:holliday junction DNA helicase RuvB, partial [Vibrio parahaemolyticus AQ3810]
VSVTMQK